MREPLPSLADSPKHFQECHDRWMERTNRKFDSPGAMDALLGHQCMSCRYFIPLVGAFIEDYGACSNANSPFDGLVRFEHDGCLEYVEGEQWQQQESPGT